MSLPVMLGMHRVAAGAKEVASRTATPSHWWSGEELFDYFSQSEYHAVVMPCLLVTCFLAYASRPTTHEVIPTSFRGFQFSYLTVWCIAVSADWLQGAYVYALYEQYGFETSKIAQLFVAGFASSLVFGIVVGPLTDKFGRKRCSIAYCILYIISCCSKHYYNYWILMFGRIMGGIATSMLYSCFECWLVSEHLQRNGFSQSLLSYMFGLMYMGMYASAIASGILSEWGADSFEFAPIFEGSIIYTGGKITPFDMAIGCLIVAMVLIILFWPENYGNLSESEGTFDYFAQGCSVMMESRSMLLVGGIVSCFEGAMFAFVFEWTPALESKTVPLPYGVVFSLFMMAGMSGSSVATLIAKKFRPGTRVLFTCLFSCVSLVISAVTAVKQVYTCFWAFMVLEFCVGLYFPSVSLIKSDTVPEHIRATVYNIYRLPLNAIVVGLLLTDLSTVACLTMCAILCALATVAMIALKWGKSEIKEAQKNF